MPETGDRLRTTKTEPYRYVDPRGLSIRLLPNFPTGVNVSRMLRVVDPQTREVLC